VKPKKDKPKKYMARDIITKFFMPESKEKFLRTAAGK
jgi:hypothetical protein